MSSTKRPRSRTDARKKSGKRKPKARGGAMLRVSLAALAVALTVAVCFALTALMPKPDPEALSAAASKPVPEGPTAEPTPSPEPTITPTPPLYAPFGAQYGFGGADLIPETPTPAPDAPVAPVAPLAATGEPTASPTGAPSTDISAAAAPTAESYVTLKKGSKGAQVSHLQQALIDLGYLSGAADGDFGQNTQDAVILFQAVNGLSADGIAGTQTQRTLFGSSALSADKAPEMDYLVLVNRERKLGKNYIPTGLVKIADVIPSSVLRVKYAGTKANRTATEALGRMLEDAIAEGIGDWQVSSAYRGYSEQQGLVDQSVSKYQKNNPSWSRDRCLSATYQTVAPAGTSEHMTGLAFDITVPGVSFTGTRQQKWLHEHCYEYGFIVRFTKEKEKLTGFLAESWHFRYVGTEAAQIMTYNNWCLEEYVEKMGL